MMKRYQVMMGKPALSSKQKITLSAAIIGPKGARKPLRRTYQPPQHKAESPQPQAALAIPPVQKTRQAPPVK